MAHKMTDAEFVQYVLHTLADNFGWRVADLFTEQDMERMRFLSIRAPEPADPDGWVRLTEEGREHGA